MSDGTDVSNREDFRPYRHIAVSVLARALLDMANPDGSRADRESARVFLNGSFMLIHWCHVAALDPAAIVTLAEKLGGGSATAASHVRSRLRVARPR